MDGGGLGERDAALAASVGAYLDEVVQRARVQRTGDLPSFVEPLAEHLGTDPRRLPVVREDVAPHRFLDVDTALRELAGPGARLLGVGGGEQRTHMGLSEMVMAATHGWAPFLVGAVDYASVPSGPGEEREVVAFGIACFEHAGVPVAVLQRAGAQHEGPRLEVLAARADVVADLLAQVRRLADERSAYRGQVLTFGGSRFEPQPQPITFLHRPVLPARDVVLPDGVLARVRRHVVGTGEHRDALRAAGQHLKRGLLLHGPPGTGKTHTVRHLLASTPGTTAVLLSGSAIAFVSAAAELARALQPALVVLEDCDLVAEARDLSAGPQPLLFEVLEVLDGLAEDADVAFVLTTNRADLLEPALAQRPGRVDLAVHVPKPDRDGREALLRLYARDLPLSAAALAAAADRTEGTTASFAKELLRRAVLLAATAGAPVADPHLAAALDELLEDGEALTRGLLGSGDEPDGGTAAAGGAFEQYAGPHNSTWG